MSTTPSTNTIPVYQRPESCHVCGGSPESHSPAGHTFWSNADAMAQALEHDRRATFRYSTGATTPEAHAVETFTPEAVAR